LCECVIVPFHYDRYGTLGPRQETVKAVGRVRHQIEVVHVDIKYRVHPPLSLAESPCRDPCAGQCGAGPQCRATRWATPTLPCGIWLHVRLSSSLPDVFLRVPPPLLEEERHPLLHTGIADVQYPVFLHGASAGPRFAADNHPVYTFEVQVAQLT